MINPPPTSLHSCSSTSYISLSLSLSDHSLSLTMINRACFGKELNHLCHSSLTKLACFRQSCCRLLWSLIHVLLCQVNPFWIQLFYFTIISSLGFFSLNMFETRPASTSTSSIKNLDVFFTSVSAATVSSMSTVEMEVFSNSQLVILTILMLVGGEVFTSMLGLHFLRYTKLTKLQSTTNTRIDLVNMGYINNHHPSTMSIKSDYQMESNLESENPDKGIEVEMGNKYSPRNSSISDKKLKYNSIKYLGYVVLAYHLIVHFCGSSLVYIYFSIVSNSAGDVLRNKGIHPLTFSVFTIVSTFSNCGFIPTNENMMVFKNNSGLLLILISQILLGNTLFPTCLRVMISVLERVTKRVEFSYMLNNTREMEYSHLRSGLFSTCLAITVLGFIAVQFILFCSMEWSSIALDGLHSHQKFVGSLFQVVNSRHAGESIVDLSIISPAILVLFVAMM